MKNSFYSINHPCYLDPLGDGEKFFVLSAGLGIRVGFKDVDSPINRDLHTCAKVLVDPSAPSKQARRNSG